MSTIAFAMRTQQQENTSPPTTAENLTEAPSSKTSGASSMVSKYLNIVAALVPAEILLLHGVLMEGAMRSTPTQIAAESGGRTVELISTFLPTEIATVEAGFYVLTILTAFLYLFTKSQVGSLQRLDFTRAFVASAGFVIWTMLQPMTAFDALDAPLTSLQRTWLALVAAILLGALSYFLSDKADQHDTSC